LSQICPAVSTVIGKIIRDVLTLNNTLRIIAPVTTTEPIMYPYPQDRNHHEREERLDALANRTFATPAQLAIWNLDDELRAIDEADLALSRGCSLNERQIHLATMAGRTREEARADAHRRFRRDYAAAVAAERVAA
jgi:hypothetical protein